MLNIGKIIYSYYFDIQFWDNLYNNNKKTKVNCN